MIFQEVVLSDHTISTPTPDPLAAVTLSHVCRLWRAIALSTSSLWAHISDIPHPAVSQFLSRSRNRPLSIQLKFNPLHTMSVGLALSVIRRAHRCKELHWIDESLGCILDLDMSAFARIAHFPVLARDAHHQRPVDRLSPLSQDLVYKNSESITLSTDDLISA